MRFNASIRNSCSEAESHNNMMNQSLSQQDLPSQSATIKGKSRSLDGMTRKNTKLPAELRDFFSKEPCLYSQEVYEHASKIFDVLKHEPNEEDPYLRSQQEKAKSEPIQIPPLDFRSENDKRLAFLLVYQTLKYQRFLEDMLEDSLFFSLYPEFKDDTCLVMVILSDFQQRKFQKRTPLPGEQPLEHVAEIEDTLYRSKTKLHAALARSRIKARVLTIDHLLPDNVRKNQIVGKEMHLCCWINQLKASINEVLDSMMKEGFREVPHEDELVGKTFMLDHQCPDIIVFSHDERDRVEGHSLIAEGHLVIQDKSSCVGPQSVRALINEGDDILHLNVGVGLTSAHVASLTHSSDSMVYAFGIHSERQYKKVMNNLEKLGAKSRVKVFQERFQDVDFSDERLKHLKVVLLTAECGRSGVANPVNFIVSEGEEMGILRDLSLGHTNENRILELVAKHNSLLKHALRFPRVQGIVYYTRSLNPAENENVITRALEYVNMVQQKKTTFRVAPPVLPLSDKDIELENPLKGKYLMYPPSSIMSGCFVATITREADDPKEAAKDILARAAARGLLSGGKGSDQQKGKANKAKSARTAKKEKAKRKKSARGDSPPRRTKSSQQKMATPAGVSGRLYSHSMHVTTPRSHTSVMESKTAVPVHTQVFPAPFANGGPSTAVSHFHQQHGTPKYVFNPPHTQVVKHPLPFR